MQRPELSSTAQYIACYARCTPEATAIVEHGSHITYLTMATDLVRCVRALEALAVRPGMLVGIQTPDRYTHLLLQLGCELSCATATTLTRTELSNVDEMARHCDVILAGEAPPAVLAPRTVAIRPDWLASLAVSPVHPEQLALLDRAIAPGQVVRIVRTSGTTGRPKAMPMTHATQQLRVTRGIDSVAEHILPNPRFLCLYQLGVGTVYARVLGVLQHGGTVLFSAMEHVHGLIAAGAVNHASFVLGDIERIVRHAVPPPEGHPLHLMVFGGALSPGLRRQIGQRLNASVTNRYSSNETNVIAIVADDNVGTLCAGVEVRIVDAAGRDMPCGEAGIIRVRTETMVHGYFNDAALTAAAFIDGWFQTSDIGRMPAPGKLIVLGRTDDVLNIGGTKIAPLPIEAEVKRIDGISDAVVMSVASRNDVGSLLVAVEIDNDRLPAGLARQIREILSRWHVTAFELMPLRWFPRTNNGKVRRREIEAMFHERQARTGTAGV